MNRYSYPELRSILVKQAGMASLLMMNVKATFEQCPQELAPLDTGKSWHVTRALLSVRQRVPYPLELAHLP